MLDDGDRRLLELGDQLEGGVGVVQIVEAELLALDLLGAGDAGARRAADIEGGLLVRVLAVAQQLAAASAQRQALGQFVAQLAGEPAGDRRVVGAGMGIGLGGQPAAQIQRGGAAVFRHLRHHRGVVLGPGDDGDEFVVLGGAADQGRPADIDVLDAGIEIGAARHRFLEGIEIDDQEVDRRDVVHRHGQLVLLVVAPRQQPAMDRRVQRLDATVHDLGEAGMVGDFGHRYVGLAQHLRRAAGRQDGDAAVVQELRELDQPRLVGDRDQGAGNLAFGHRINPYCFRFRDDLPGVAVS